MFRTMWRKLFRRSNQPQRIITKNKRALPQLARLEDRTVPASLTDGGTAILTITLDNANEQLAIVSNGATYGFTSTNNFTNGGVADTADFSAFGAMNLTLNATGLTRYSTINIVDAAAGAKVSFNDSAANAYSDIFTVTLDDAAAGNITFNGATTFTGSSALIAGTSRQVLVFGNVSTADGDLALSANQQALATAGNFQGIQIQGMVATTGAGNIVLNGRGGDDAATASHTGVAVLGGKVASTGAGKITIVGTGGVGSNQNLGVTVEGATGIITSVIGQIDITGTGGNGNVGVGVAVFGGGTISSTGVGAGAASIMIKGVGASISPGSSAGFRTEGAGSGIKTVDGAITLSATKTVANEAVLLNGGTIDSTGTGTVTLIADSMALGSAINAGTNSVTLRPMTAGTKIDVGGPDGVGTLGLTDGELDKITAGLVQIGDVNTGNITISANISNSNNLTLITGQGITGTGDITNGTATATTLTLNQVGNSTYSGRIGGPAGGTANDKNLALVNQGAGTLKLAGSNTYTGTTTVSQGTLIINGTSGLGTVTVKNGATIGGTGTIGDATTDLVVESGGTLSPGDGGVGTLTVGDELTLMTGSTFLIDISGMTADHIVAKKANIADGVNLLGTVTSPAAGAFTLIDANLNVTGNGFKDVNGKSLPPNKGGPIVIGGSNFNYDYTGNKFRLMTIGTSVVLDGGGNLIITDIIDKDDALTVERIGADIRITDPVNPLLAGMGVKQIDANTVEVPFANITGKMQINTGKGDDAVVLKVGGGIIPAGGITYDGGAAGNDRLAVRGSGVETAVYTPSKTVTGDGQVAVNGATITFTGLEPVDIDGMALATLVLPGAGDQVDIINGFDDATGAIPALVVTGKSGGVAFEQAHFFNNTTVLIDTTTVDGNDTITITSADNAHANTNLTIITGAGVDSLTANGKTKVAGTIDFSSGVVALNADVEATAGNATITASGDLTVAATVTAGMTAKLTAGSKIIDGNGATNNVAAMALVAGAATGIDLDTAVTDITATTSGAGDIIIREANGANVLNVAATTGNATVTTTTGNLNVTTVSASATVNLKATAGKITDANAGATNITAIDFVGSAATGIDLDTKVTTITATTTGAGAILLDEFDGVTLTNVTAANGPITITTAGDTTITNVVSSTDTDANDISIAVATGDATVTAVNAGTTAGDVTLKTTTGNIFDDGVNGTLITGDVVTLTADRSVGQPGATADMDTAANSWVLATTGAGPFVGAPTPGIWVTDTNAVTVTSATTGDGVILLASGGKMTVATVTAGGIGRNVRLTTTAGDIDLGVVTAAGDSVLLLSAGAITDNNAGNNVTALNLEMKAGTGIGAGNAIETTVSNLAATATAGNIEVANSIALTLTELTTFGTTVTGVTTPADVTISTDAITVAKTISGDCVIIQPNSDNTIDATLGANPAGQLALDQTELDLITANASAAAGRLAGFEVKRRFYEIGSLAGLEETRKLLAEQETE